MVARLQHIADDIAERLLILEIELRSRSLERRIEALEGLGPLVACLDLFRLELEEQQPPVRQLAATINRLDRQVSSIRRSEAYKVAAWLNAAELRWYVNPASSLTAMC